MLDASSASFFRFYVDEFCVSPVVLVLGFLVTSRCVQNVVVVGLEDGGALFDEFLQDSRPGSEFPSRDTSDGVGLVDLHLGGVVLLAEFDVLVLWQVLVEEDLLDDIRDGLVYTLSDAAVQEFHIVLDGTDVFLAEGQDLDGQVEVFDDDGGVVRVVGCGDVCIVAVGRVVDGDRRFMSVDLFMPRKTVQLGVRFIASIALELFFLIQQGE